MSQTLLPHGSDKACVLLKQQSVGIECVRNIEDQNFIAICQSAHERMLQHNWGSLLQWALLDQMNGGRRYYDPTRTRLNIPRPEKSACHRLVLPYP